MTNRKHTGNSYEHTQQRNRRRHQEHKRKYVPFATAQERRASRRRSDLSFVFCCLRVSGLGGLGGSGGGVGTPGVRGAHCRGPRGGGGVGYGRFKMDSSAGPGRDSTTSTSVSLSSPRTFNWAWPRGVRQCQKLTSTSSTIAFLSRFACVRR